MTSYSIVFRKNESANIAAVKLWQKKYGISKPSFLFTLCFLINIFAALLILISIYFEKNIDLKMAIMTIILQIPFITFYVVKRVKGIIVPELSKSMDLRIKECSDKTEITLRENDFEIKTQYKKTNYFYDEVECCFDMDNFSMIVVDKYAYPIVISYNSLKEGDREGFSALLKEKLQDKYERGV